MNQHFSAGMKAAIPACLADLPIAFSVGLLGTQAGIGIARTILMSSLVMAGSSQLAAIDLITQGAAASVVLLSTFFINLRLIVMSSSVMGQLRDISLPRRLLGAWVLSDESFAIFSLSGDQSYAFLLGLNTALYICFVGSTILGCLMSSLLPQIVIDSFGVAFYAAFLALLLPSVKGRPLLIALVVLTAALNGLLQCFLPSTWSLILSMVLGAAFGVFFVEDAQEVTS